MATDKTNYHVKVQLDADSTPGEDKLVIWDESGENFTLGDYLPGENGLDNGCVLLEYTTGNPIFGQFSTDFSTWGDVTELVIGGPNIDLLSIIQPFFDNGSEYENYLDLVSISITSGSAFNRIATPSGVATGGATDITIPITPNTSIGTGDFISGNSYTICFNYTPIAGTSGTSGVDGVYIICKQLQPGPGFVEFDITQPQGGVLYETSSYMKAEFYGLRTGSTDQRYQSARTVATWLRGENAGDPPTRFSTFEDVRSPDDKIIYNIKTVTGSWENNGDTLRVKIYQYNIDDVDYCLRYVVF